jgi:diguanylate cyclase (GGDEF)-like protein
VTAEREADLRVQQALGELERAVAERTAELEEAKARAQHLADHDALTGLPNRRLLEDRLTQALALSHRNRKNSAVMFVDIDRFKTINDSLGHAVGDSLLKEVAARLVKQLREGDTICRIGGDEFVIVLPEVKRSSDVAHVAQKVIEQLSQPILVEERELVVTSSIGIAVYPDDGRDAESLIRNADAAMYHAKELGRANYQFFTEQMNQAASRRLQLESDLRRAVGKGELRVHYQPVLDAASGRIAAHEALVRWEHPKRGLVHPVEFIQLAEETGIILKIGEWILAEACRWNTFIGARSHDGGELQIAVNLSARQFNDPHLPKVVARALKDSGLPPRLLELEITESTAMQQTDATLKTLKKLKQLGEDRPQLRRRGAGEPRPGRDRRGDHRARARAADPGGRRGRGNRGAAQVPQVLRLRLRAGLSRRPAVGLRQRGERIRLDARFTSRTRTASRPRATRRCSPRCRRSSRSRSSTRSAPTRAIPRPRAGLIW